LFDSIPLLPSKVPKRTHRGEENKLDEGDFVAGVGSGGIGSVKLADFGFSKMILGNLAATPCGTMGYAAPEIVDDQKYSTSVDMWALGCVLFALLAGYPPFYDPNIKLLMKRVSKGQFAFDSPWWDNISEEAKDLITNLLTVEPTKRFTIKEFMAHPWTRQGAPELSQQDPPQAEDSIKQESPRYGSQLAVPGQPENPSFSGSEEGEHETPPSSASLDGRGQVECRTPDVMNVGEIFDVAFSVHQLEEERRNQERILGKLSSTKEAITAMSQLALSGDKASSLDQASRKQTQQADLSLDNSSLLERRRSRPQRT
jgi:serine/threonine protein kinase